VNSILAFGDSLTWGFEAGTFKRHAFENRWPNALAAGLGGTARVIEEGLNGRTTVFPDPTAMPERNGAVALPMLLETHQPLDLVIIILGTNDIKYANGAVDQADEVSQLHRRISATSNSDHVATRTVQNQ
jgi:lysophospholipase L1-like esterase